MKIYFAFFSWIILLSACAGAPTSTNGVDRTIASNAEDLQLCSETEKSYVKLGVFPGYRYRHGEIKRLIEKSGPSMRDVYYKLNGEEAPYLDQPDHLANATRIVEGDTNCTRYQPLQTLDGKPNGIANCRVYTCTFIERQP